MEPAKFMRDSTNEETILEIRQAAEATCFFNLIDRNNQQGIFHEINEYSSYSFLKTILGLNEYL
ncbi:hypothetical protein [Paenibacillus alginolyticus]|uniref:Uncharacterized protein n=1 Tax=Paenibacillus alginolyticus TaxID=59839 RepID=A0ABT4GP24_9BACL|nr:hypothetical protein [Paenibacillus alginolyticus]MCY9697963.1 hypothetical protein [Paenibacillus alginolyticus]MEC0148220.1 hypothetical protein [Paenibacillus alginolyticus]